LAVARASAEFEPEIGWSVTVVLTIRGRQATGTAGLCATGMRHAVRQALVSAIGETVSSIYFPGSTIADVSALHALYYAMPDGMERKFSLLTSSRGADLSAVGVVQIAEWDGESV